MVKRLSMFMAMLLLCVTAALAQTKVTGTVVSKEDGEPVVGASVLIVGTKMGTITNVDGEFQLSVPSDKSTLRVSYLGMKTVEVAAGSNLRIELISDASTLNDVVVTAQGLARQKRSLGYATQEIKGSDITAVNTSDLNNALVGKVAGVRFVGGSAAKFDEGGIVLRGTTSVSDVTGSSPIYVIDGVIASSNAVNTADIASVNVLKGPAATALYGVRGGNGAIVITTKSGQLGADRQEVNVGHTI